MRATVVSIFGEEKILSVERDITERKKAEDAVRASKARLKAIFDLARVAIGILDTNGKWIQANQHTEELLGYSAEELRHLNHIDVTHLDDIEASRQGLRDLANGKLAEYHLEKRLIRKDGTIAWVDQSVTAIRNEESKPVAFITAAFDITERKKAEDALRDSQENLQAIFDLTGVAIGITDTQGKWLQVNKSMEKLLGYTAEELEHLHITNVTHPDDIETTKQAMRDLLDGRVETQPVEKRYIRKDGTTIWVDLSITPIRSRGKIVAFIGASFDITDRKRAEQALKESEDRFRALTQNASDIVYILDPDTKILFVTQSVENVLGYREDETIGKKASDFVHPDDLPNVLSSILYRMEHPEIPAGIIQLRSRHKDGSWRIIEGKGINLFDNPAVRGIVFTGRDITERKRAEQVLQEQKDLLSTIFESSPSIMMLVTEDVRVTKINHAGVAFAGRSAEELVNLLGGQVFNCVNALMDGGCGKNAPCTTCPVRTRVGKTMETGESFFNETGRLILQKGDQQIPLDFLISTSRVTTSDGDQVLITITDISSLKQAEQDLRRSEIKYHSLFENAAVSIWEEDFSQVKNFLNELGDWKTQDLVEYLDAHPEHLEQCANLVKVIDVNQESRHLFPNALQDELEKYKISEHFADESWRVFKEELAALMDSETRFESESSFLNRDDKISRTLFRLSVVPGYEQTLERVLVSFIDITERKEMEEELASLSRRLFGAQETERRNIARELHDEVGQVLTAVKSNLQTSKLLTDREMSSSFLNESIDIVDRAMQQVRDLSLNLRPSLLDDFGLVPALEWYVNRQAHRLDIVADFSAEPHEMELPQALATTCFRVAQAALTNVERHAQAKRVRVDLRLHPHHAKTRDQKSELLLTIVDDGVGFDVPAAIENAKRGKTLGLTGMQERVRLAGGHMEIHSRPMQGTEISVRFPIVQPAVEHRGEHRKK